MTNTVDPVCACPKCVACCYRWPGWMTPEEALRAIEAGRASDLMKDWWVPSPVYGHYVEVLCPAVEGYEGDFAPEVTIAEVFLDNVERKCTLLENDRCTIHDSGFKPIVCRTSLGCGEPGTQKEDLLHLWHSAEGRRTITAWHEALGR